MTPGVSYTYTGGCSLIFTVPVRRRVIPGSAPIRNAFPERTQWKQSYKRIDRPRVESYEPLRTPTLRSAFKRDDFPTFGMPTTSIFKSYTASYRCFAWST